MAARQQPDVTKPYVPSIPTASKVPLHGRADVITEQNVMTLGVLLFAMMNILPLLNSLVLLTDPSFNFWVGWLHPVCSILCSAFLMVLLITCLYIVHTRTRSRQHVDALFAFTVIANFSMVFGMALVLISLDQSKHTYEAAHALSIACGPSLANSRILTDYDRVLYNLRKQPDCINEESIVDCRGWSENKYTRYIKYLEEEFNCGPLCGEEATGVNASFGGGQALLQVGTGRGARGQPGRGRAQALLATDVAPVNGPAGHMPPQVVTETNLFSQGSTRITCYPLVSTRLRALANGFSDQSFWAGIGLLMLSGLSLVVSFLLYCFGLKTGRYVAQTPRQDGPKYVTM